MKTNKQNLIIILLILVFLLMPLFFILQLELKTEAYAINNRDYVPVLLSEIKSADKSINIAMFSITYYDNYENSSANQILKALAEAQKRNIQVQVIIDEFPEEHEKGIAFLKQNNISVKYDGKKQTTHAKLVIIDSKEIIIGSSNWRYYSLDKNNEANVLIKSKALAKQYSEYFEEIWKNGEDT